MSDNIKPDNPAGRLYLILRNLDRGNNENTTFRDLIASRFEIDPGDLIAITSIHLALLNLVKTTRDTVNRLDLGDLYLKPIDDLQAGFSSIGLNHQWSNYRKFISPVAMNSLMFISDRLSQTSISETRLPNKEVDELINDVESLIEAVNNAREIPDQFRQLLLGRLEGILQALVNYKLGFNGNEVFEEEVALTIGSIVINHTIVQDVQKNSEEGKKLYKNFLKVVSSLSKIVATVGAKELVEEIIPQIPLLVDKVKDVIN